VAPHDLPGVLIDGGHAAETEGTGVSAYARLLATAACSLGRRVAWLRELTVAAGRDPLLREAAAHDRPPESTGPRRRLTTLGLMAEGVATGHVRPRRVPATGAVAPEFGVAPPVDALGATRLFRRAHYRHMLLRRLTRVAMPEAFGILHLSAPLPLRPARGALVTTIHDLIPLRLPWATPDNKAEFLARLRALVAGSAMVTTVSEASRRDIIELLGAAPDRVAVTPIASRLARLGPGESALTPAVLGRYGLEAGRYALFVGAIEPKKNLRRLIEAFLDVDCDWPLAISGRRAWMWERELAGLEAALAPPARERVRFLGYVAEEELRHLHAAAGFLAIPSLLEGFGIPALDSMRFGRPVLASRTPALEETCGPAALYVDPRSRADIRAGLARLVSDAGLRAELGRLGEEQARRFTPERFAAALAEVYSKIA
jgi:glycosyltransferase involved in cell wall biosynthesis